MDFTKSIIKAVKEHNAEREGLTEYNKGIKFLSMTPYNKPGYENFVICHDGESLTRFELKCSFKPEHKYDNNIVKYQVNVYSGGTIVFYFDGTEYAS